MTNHSSAVYSIAQINQYQVATASGDFTIKVWNMSTGRTVNTYYAHTNYPTSLAILPSGILASGGIDQTIRYWNMQTQTVSTVSATCSIVATKFNSKYGALFTAGAYVNKYDAVTFNSTGIFNTGRAYNDFDIHLPTGDVLAVGGANNVLEYINITGNTWAPIYYNSSTGHVIRIVILPDNVTVVVGLDNGQLRLLSLSTSSWGSLYTEHTAAVSTLTVTPDMLCLVSGGSDSSIVVWTWTTESLTKVNKFTVAGSVQSLAFMTTVYTGSKT
jgi:WD40 repeat protein